MSIKTGLLSFVAVIFGFMLLLLVSYSELIEEYALERQLRELMQEKSANVMGRTERVLAGAKFTGERTAALLARGGVESQAGRSLERYLLYQVSTSQHMTGMYIGWSNGDFLYVKGAQGPGNGRFRTLRVDAAARAQRVWRDEAFAVVSRERGIELDFDPRARPWYVRARDRGETVWTEPYLFNTSRNPGITLAVPVLEDGGSIEAVVGIDMDIQLLSKLLGELPLPPQSEAVLTTMEGTVVASTDGALSENGAGPEGALPRLRDLADGPLKAALAVRDRVLLDADAGESAFFPFTWEDVRYHAYFTGIPGSTRPWVVGLAVPDAAFLGSLREQRGLYLASIIFLLVVGAIAALVIARALLRPIQELASIAADVRERGFGAQPRLRSRFTEIRNLSASLRRLLGRLEARQSENEALNEQLRDLNRRLEEQVRARTEELRQKNVELERLASTDSLTGALNLRAFIQAVERERERAARHASELSLAILDVDHFKRINDTYGHAVGDEVLVRIVAACRKQLRGADLLARIGGEEFAILLPNTGREGAVKTAERLRQELEQTRLPTDDGVTVDLSVSIGVAEFVIGEDYESLSARADGCLYRAKEQGRNRVCSTADSAQ